MASNKGLEWTFNTVAAQYDRWSPSYIPQLYADLLAYRPLDASSHALEVGIGTGQATPPILSTGCTLTAVELGDQLADFTRRKFSSYDNLCVVTSAFEDYEGADNHLDLLYSARAFHWVPEEIGYPKAYRMLKSGGAFARFASHQNYHQEQESMHAAIQKVYTRYMPGSAPSPAYSAEAAARRSGIAAKYGFTDIDYKLYYRTRSYSAQDYLSLIGLYSDHIALTQPDRQGLFGGIEAAIEHHGGTILLFDTIELNLARKP